MTAGPIDGAADHEVLASEVRRFAAEQLNDHLLGGPGGHEPAAGLPEEAWRRCAAFGIQGLPVPREHGGSDADPATTAVVLEALGHGCRDNGLLFSLGAQLWSCELPLVRFGSPEQQARYLPGLCDGTLIGVQAMTEPGSGSDAYALTTRATPVDSGFRLDGTKVFITNAPVADVFIVFATTDPGAGFGSLCAFLVDRDTPGLSVGPPLSKMGLHTSPTAEVVLAGCEVPATAMLGAPGAGFAVFTAAMTWERLLILAPAIGTMQRQLDACIAFAREREQFGQPIGKFQSVANRIVDMKLRVDTSRLLLHDAVGRVDRRSGGMAASMVKLHVSESFLQSSLDAVQVHGGAGYTSDLDFERDVRDAVAARIYSGTSEIQRGVIARGLGL
jgi:alkylation response protein AidB-like acyl-CoA dehydrogenase